MHIAWMVSSSATFPVAPVQDEGAACGLEGAFKVDEMVVMMGSVVTASEAGAVVVLLGAAAWALGVDHVTTKELGADIYKLLTEDEGVFKGLTIQGITVGGTPRQTAMSNVAGTQHHVNCDNAARAHDSTSWQMALQPQSVCWTSSAVMPCPPL